MAASSIFHTVVIDDPQKAEAFIAAIESSIADPYNSKTTIDANMAPTKDDIRRLHELRRRIERLRTSYGTKPYALHFKRFDDRFSAEDNQKYIQFIRFF